MASLLKSITTILMNKNHKLKLTFLRIEMTFEEVSGIILDKLIKIRNPRIE